VTNANRKITADLISDHAAGRLDADDVQVMEDAINRHENGAAAVAAARRVDARMNSTSKRGIRGRCKAIPEPPTSSSATARSCSRSRPRRAEQYSEGLAAAPGIPARGAKPGASSRRGRDHHSGLDRQGLLHLARGQVTRRRTRHGS